MSKSDGLEFLRFILETYEPEKQKAILTIIEGIWMAVQNEDKLSKAEWRLLMDTLEKLPKPQYVGSYENLKEVLKSKN